MGFHSDHNGRALGPIVGKPENDNASPKSRLAFPNPAFLYTAALLMSKNPTDRLLPGRSAMVTTAPGSCAGASHDIEDRRVGDPFPD